MKLEIIVCGLHGKFLLFDAQRDKDPFSPSVGDEQREGDCRDDLEADDDGRDGVVPLLVSGRVVHGCDVDDEDVDDAAELVDEEEVFVEVRADVLEQDEVQDEDGLEEEGVEGPFQESDDQDHDSSANEQDHGPVPAAVGDAAEKEGAELVAQITLLETEEAVQFVRENEADGHQQSENDDDGVGDEGDAFVCRRRARDGRVHEKHRLALAVSEVDVDAVEDAERVHERALVEEEETAENRRNDDAERCDFERNSSHSLGK